MATQAEQSDTAVGAARVRASNLSLQRTEVWLWAAMLLIGGMLAWLSVASYVAYKSQMFDLGNMAQAIWSATQGEPLLFTQPSGNNSRLSGHVELIYFLFAPFYALWPDPRLLLVGQAGLFTLGALPVFWMTRRRTDSASAALMMAFIYLLYPVANTAVLSDFHGDTLAIAPLLFALDALDRRAWWAYGVAVGLALLCKFYVALPVAGMGFVALVWGEHRRAGALTLAAGVAYGALVVLVVRPLFAEASVVQSVTGYTRYYFGDTSLLLSTLLARLLYLIFAFVPLILLIRHGWRWLLPGLPIVAAVLVGTGPSNADYRSHHYAVVVPFMLMAMIDAVGRMKVRQDARLALPPGERRRGGRRWQNDLGFTLVLTVITNMLLVNTPLSPLYWALPGHWLSGPAAYERTARDALKDAFLAEHVPPDAPLVASTLLAPHLTNRHTLHLARSALDPLPIEERLTLTLPQVDYVVTDALFDFALLEGVTTFERPTIAYVLRDPAFHLVQARDGLLLFERAPPPDAVLEQRVDVRPAAEVPPMLARFGPSIGLVDAAFAPLEERRFRARFAWYVDDAPPAGAAYVAVSRLYDANGEPVEGARMVHLPTYALHPADEWQADTLLAETFEVEIPPEVPPGRYRWRVGWYDLRAPGAYRTDESSRLPQSMEVAAGTIRVVE